VDRTIDHGKKNEIIVGKGRRRQLCQVDTRAQQNERHARR